MTRPFFSVEALAERWGVSTRTVRRLVKKRSLLSIRIGSQLRFDPEFIQQYEAHYRTAAFANPPSGDPAPPSRPSPRCLTPTPSASASSSQRSAGATRCNQTEPAPTPAQVSHGVR
jgi:excisionase family DNA binding protein